MTDADDRLRALFAEDAPPARDPVFSTAVMEEIVRRRFIGDVALLAVTATAGGFVLWALWPVLSPLGAELSRGLMPVAACLTLAAAAVMLLDARVAPSDERNHG